MRLDLTNASTILECFVMVTPRPILLCHPWPFRFIEVRGACPIGCLDDWTLVEKRASPYVWLFPYAGCNMFDYRDITFSAFYFRFDNFSMFIQIVKKFWRTGKKSLTDSMWEIYPPQIFLHIAGIDVWEASPPNHRMICNKNQPSKWDNNEQCILW